MDGLGPGSIAEEGGVSTANSQAVYKREPRTKGGREK